MMAATHHQLLLHHTLAGEGSSSINQIGFKVVLFILSSVKEAPVYIIQEKIIRGRSEKVVAQMSPGISSKIVRVPGLDHYNHCKLHSDPLTQLPDRHINSNKTGAIFSQETQLCKQTNKLSYLYIKAFSVWIPRKQTFRRSFQIWTHYLYWQGHNDWTQCEVK